MERAAGRTRRPGGWSLRRAVLGAQLALAAAGIAVGVYASAVGDTLIDLSEVFAEGDIAAEEYTPELCAKIGDSLGLNPNAYAGPPSPPSARYYFAEPYAEHCPQ